MVGARPCRRIEQNERGGTAFVAGDGITVFAEPGAYAVSAHRHPVWKAVLPRSGEVSVDGATGAAGAGVLVPPQYAHTCAASSGFVAVFLDPWCVRADPSGPTWLGARTARRLLDALGHGGLGVDVEALRRELAAAAGPPATVDPRVVCAVRGSARAARLDTLAADVGLSPARLRALVRTEVGIPLGALRRWQRLRTAVGALVADGGAIAAAASDAGFADQAHLTRTVRTLAGRTPGSLLTR
ncbi:helix-turn-helix domain-containing protein [Streptomyces sp. NPDC059063]|uniref:helix-turn-helix domain-containing protein n=1 Tax=unclassified Streptomyces TaxID=2593676 RepID=UPI00369B6514